MQKQKKKKSFFSDKWFDDAEIFRKQLYASKIDFSDIHELLTGAECLGWKKSEINFEFWLFDYLGRFLEAKKQQIEKEENK